jgi:hypothetical protein
VKSTNSYPTGRDYSDAVSNPAHCFQDAALRASVAVTDHPGGLPRPISGNFATVFTLTEADSHRWAVKCFTRAAPDQQERYGRISATLNYGNPDWRVPFEYVEEGILFGARRYPILKMEWIEATGLIPYIEGQLGQPLALSQLASAFADLVRDMSDRGIAHGDLQHGNLLVARDGSLRLVDYDGMYVPGLEQLGASELGHPNYQSPQRTMAHWGRDLDRFSAWVVYCSLLALSLDPGLWHLLHTDGDEALILTQADYSNPAGSLALRFMLQSSDPRLTAIGQKLRDITALDLGAVPPLEPATLPAPAWQPVTSTTGHVRGSVSTVSAAAESTTPDWLATLNSPMPVSVSLKSDPSWILGHLPPVERVTFQSVPVALARSMFAATILAIAALAVLYATKQVPVLDVGVSLPAVISLSTIALLMLMRRAPESRDKRSLGIEVRELHHRAASAHTQLEKAATFRKKIDKREHEELRKVDKLARKTREAEQSDLSKIDTQLRQRVGKIDADLQRLDRDRDREKSVLLRPLQQAHISKSLANASVSGAGLPGIGIALCRTLAMHGIATAADFTGIGVSNGQAYIRLRSGRAVHPRGIGPVKAQALENWRQSLLARAQATQPTQLPVEQSLAITAKYAARRAALEASGRDAKSAAERDRQQIRDRWKPIHADIEARVLQTRATYGQYRSDGDLAVITARRSVDSAAWLEAAGKHRLSAYSGVRYSAYLARSIRG